MHFAELGRQELGVKEPVRESRYNNTVKVRYNAV